MRIDGTLTIDIHNDSELSVSSSVYESEEIELSLDGGCECVVECAVETVLDIPLYGECGIFTPIYSGDYPPYIGETVVIPKAHDETILQTKHKGLDEDITVRKIPYYETSNESGTTVYIADEV